MPLFLVTSVCDEGVGRNNFKVVEADSRLAIAQHILDHPWAWERMLRPTKLWWKLTYFEYKYGRPRGWTAADLLAQIDSTWVDGDSSNQFRIHEIEHIERLPDPRGADQPITIGGTSKPVMELLNDQELLAVCDGELDKPLQEMLSDLLEQNQEGTLDAANRSRLDELMQVYRTGLVRKAQALALAIDRRLRPRLS